MWRWRRRHPPAGTQEHQAADAVADVGAFLLGTSAEWFRAHGQPVPAWAWLNAVAHASPEALEELRRPVPEPRGATASADGPLAVATVAATLWWRAAGDPTALWALQREVLVPLELALMAGRAHVPDAQGAARLALAALRQEHPPAAQAPAPGEESPP